MAIRPTGGQGSPPRPATPLLEVGCPVVSAAQGVTDGVLQLHLHPLDADARPLLFTRANKITFGKVQASLKNRRVR